MIRETSKLERHTKREEEGTNRVSNQQTLLVNKEEIKKSKEENSSRAKIMNTPGQFYDQAMIATYKEGSVNDISSASSFSGNR